MDGSQDRPAFERGTGFLLARLGTLTQRSWSAFLSEVGLTQSQYAVLYVLAERGELGQRRLAKLATIEPRNVVHVVNVLASTGLLERAVDPADRRRRNVTITPDGAALMDLLALRLRHETTKFFVAITEDEYVTLNELLLRLLVSHIDEVV